MYAHYGRAGAIPTQRVYRLSDWPSSDLIGQVPPHFSANKDIETRKLWELKPLNSFP